MKAILHRTWTACGASILALALALASTAAKAQDSTSKLTCFGVGGGAPEPIGDREGHSISVLQTVCRFESGLESGGILTSASIFEWDKTSAVEIAGSGVIRGPDFTVVYEDTEGKIALTIADGKITGAAGSGRGVYKLATGRAASLAGKSFVYTATSPGPGQVTIENKVE